MSQVGKICRDKWLEILVGLISVAIPALITMANGKIDKVEKTTKIYVDTKHDSVMYLLKRQEKILDRRS